MRARLAAAAAALAFGAALLAPAPAAQAGNMTLTHYSPDDGYAEPFWVNRTNGQTVPIWPGASVGSVSQVYVAAGTQIVCYYGGVGWRIWKDATGWHDAGGSSQSCVNQLD
jgi:hypothetical protein